MWYDNYGGEVSFMSDRERRIAFLADEIDRLDDAVDFEEMCGSEDCGALCEVRARLEMAKAEVFAIVW